MTSGDSETVRDRLRQLFCKEYAGSQRAMLLQIGYDPSVLIRTVDDHVALTFGEPVAAIATSTSPQN